MELVKNIIAQFNGFTYSQKKIANYMMDHLDQIPMSSLADLSSKIGVSTTSVIRFARELGYEGYSDLQDNIRGISFEIGHVPEPEGDGTEGRELENELFRAALTTDIKNIQETMNSISQKALMQAVELLCEANNVYVLGMRSSYAVAYYMAGRLGEIRKNVRIIQSSGMMYPEEIIGVRQEDVLLAYLFPKYSRVATNITSWIKSRGAKVILVTGMNDAPIRDYGDVILPCETCSVSFRNSYAAPLSISNYMAQAIFDRLGTEAEENRRKTEELLDQGYYLPL